MNLTPVEFVVVALASWRVAFLLVGDVGPYQVFRRLRTRFPLGGLTSCIYCMTCWTAPLMYVLWRTPLAPVVTVFALMGAALMASSYTGANHG